MQYDIDMILLIIGNEGMIKIMIFPVYCPIF